MKLIRNITLAAVVILSGTGAFAQNSAGKSVAPMPNLMPVIMQHGEMLDLTATQKEAFAIWRKKHRIAQQNLSKEIRGNQAAMLVAALEEKPIDELLAMEKVIDSKRVKFITRKAACRDNMKKILSSEQWAQLISIYKEENGLN